MKAPKTLQEAVLYFSDFGNCLQYMVFKRWPDGVVTCPTCGRDDVSFLDNQRKWQCKSSHAKNASSRPKSEPSSRIRPSRWRSGCSWFGWSATARTASAATRSLRTSASLKSRHGSCSIASGGYAKQRGYGSQTKIGGGGGEVEVDETWVGGKVHQHAQRAPSALRAGWWTSRQSGGYGNP